MTVAYVDGVSGASGDMLLGSLLDAGWPVDALQATLARFPLAGWSLRAERVQRQGIAATQVSFDLPKGQPLRHLDDLLQLLAGAQMPGSIHDRIERVLRALAGAEAAVHGIPVETSTSTKSAHWTRYSISSAWSPASRRWELTDSLSAR